MPIQRVDTPCPLCGEDAETLITTIKDRMGERRFCCVCGKEFQLPKKC